MRDTTLKEYKKFGCKSTTGVSNNGATPTEHEPEAESNSLTWSTSGY